MPGLVREGEEMQERIYNLWKKTVLVAITTGFETQSPDRTGHLSANRQAPRPGQDCCSLSQYESLSTLGGDGVLYEMLTCTAYITCTRTRSI